MEDVISFQNQMEPKPKVTFPPFFQIYIPIYKYCLERFYKTNVSDFKMFQKPLTGYVENVIVNKKKLKKLYVIIVCIVNIK